MKHTLVLAATMLTLMGCQSTNSASINANPGKPTEAHRTHRKRAKQRWQTFGFIA
ncbi:hypothetical protein [Pseudoalteromonas xiamenensis]|uniref:hypothetical protein n=1 Tax=Pseudoalteromonas xiamenensis TaxID=882626 RepID=UPI001FCB8EA3|nr:hypothetical protein [Pseudoalteromonas xiamenensis]